MAPPFHSSHAHPQNLAEIKRLRTELLQHAENALLAERKNASSLLEIKKITDSRIAHMKKQYCAEIGPLRLHVIILHSTAEPKKPYSDMLQILTISRMSPANKRTLFQH
jgi:hypothetical protein